MIETSEQVINEKIERVIEKLNIVGLSAAVVEKNEVIWEGYYGLAHLEQGKPVNPHTVYRIASISKSIMATAIMQQFEKGKFQLDDDISHYLGYEVRNPNFPNTPVTFKHLFTHTSSLQDEYVDFVMSSYNDNPPSLKEILVPGGKFYSDAVWGNYEPGDVDHFVYSNLASIVVATLLEKLSGERFDVYCKNNIFKPLGMNETSFNIEDINLEEIAVLYNFDEEQNTFAASLDSAGKNRPKKIDLSNYVPGTNGGIFSPQGGARSTAQDLTKFLIAHMNGGTYNDAQILMPETVQLMHREHWSGLPQAQDESFYRSKGIHFIITNDLVPGQTVKGHSGDAYGMLSGLYFDENYERGIVFLTNGSVRVEGKMFRLLEEELAEVLFSI